MNTLAEQLADYRAKALAAVPTVEPTPGLVAVWELVEGYHELYRGSGLWLLLDHAQRSRVKPAEGEAPTIYLRLEGPTETRRSKVVDPASGAVVFGRSFSVHLGPVIVTRADALVRARPRVVEEVAAP